MSNYHFGKATPVCSIGVEAHIINPRDYSLDQWVNCLNCFLDQVAAGNEARLDFSTVRDDAYASLLSRGEGMIGVRVGGHLNHAIPLEDRKRVGSLYRSCIDFSLSPNDGWLLKRLAQTTRRNLQEVLLAHPDHVGTGLLIKKLPGNNPLGISAYIPWVPYYPQAG